MPFGIILDSAFGFAGIPTLLNEAHSFKNNSSQCLEFMLIGMATQYLTNGRTMDVPPALQNLCMRLILLVALLAYPLIAREPLAKRIVHTDPSKYSREAVPVHLNDAHSFVNDGTGDLEFLIVGVARQKGNLE